MMTIVLHSKPSHAYFCFLGLLNGFIKPLENGTPPPDVVLEFPDIPRFFRWNPLKQQQQFGYFFGGSFPQESAYL
ncbi:MAG: hypothetical protein HQL74_13175 [Magnetococcales bacterium]|nr:hypothetical protein [Magnetococcales bacterium]